VKISSLHPALVMALTTALATVLARNANPKKA
jgi:hypothetical protein